jgi:multicomponent Na+:H+ antiporter subunit G
MRFKGPGLRCAAALLPAALAAVAAAETVVVEADVARFDGNVLAEALILFGCVFILVSALGVLRFPDVYTRLHASTKLVSVAGIGIFGGAALAFSPVEATGRVLLIALFFFLTAPLSGYMIARAAYLRGIAPYWEDDSIDEWDERGSALPPAKDGGPNGEDGTTRRTEVL